MLSSDVMTVEDVSVVLRITKSRVQSRISEGLDMPRSFRVGRQRLFLRRDFEDWLLARANAYADVTASKNR